MSNDLQRRLDRLETQKSSLLTQIASLPPAQLNNKPAEDSWSALEVLDHLHKVEHSILDAVIDTIPEPAPRRPSTRDQIQSLLLRGLFLLPSRVKTPPTATAILPEKHLHLAEIEQHWASTRERLHAVVNSFPAPLLPMGIFRHPVCGWMTLPQTLGFLSAHLTHHNYQLRRLRRSFGRA